jgi:WD40 repeat protein
VCTWDNQGNAFSGCANGSIFKWVDRNAVEAVEAHKGYIGAIRAVDGKLFTGGQDNKVMIWNSADMSHKKTIDFNSRALSIDFLNDKLLVSFRDGDIIEINGEDIEGKKTLMKSHDNGEVWGLADCGLSHIATTGDDNKVMIWDIDKRLHAITKVVSDEKKNSRKGKASSVSNLPAS